MNEWDEHSETESFLIEIQGRPELMYTDIEMDLYKGLLDKVKNMHPTEEEKKLLKASLEKDISRIVQLIEQYMDALDKAAMRLGHIPQQEKDSLSDLFEEISDLEIKIGETYEKAF